LIFLGDKVSSIKYDWEKFEEFKKYNRGSNGDANFQQA
jgi:hypothetical protein